MVEEKQSLLSVQNNGDINSDSPPPPYFNKDECNKEVSPWEQNKWKKYLFFVMPVEIVLFFYLFQVYFQMQVSQQYFYQRIFRGVIDNWTNESQLNFSFDHTCLTEDKIMNATNGDAFVSGQERINYLSMLTTITFLLPSIVVSPFIGSLSDQIGRKPILFFVYCGQLVAAILSILIVYFQLSMYLFFVTSFITGVTGGFGVMLSTGFAYVSDITTSRKWLTIRMSILEASIFVGVAASSASADTWIEKTDCIFRPQVWISLVCIMAGMACTFVMPESLPEKYRIKSLSEFKLNRLYTLFRGFRLFFLPSYIGCDMWKLWIILIVSSMAVLCETGNNEISSYFLYNKPLQWSYSTIGIYMAVSSVSHLLALIVVLPVMVALKFPNSLIAIIGLIISCGMNVYVALLTSTAEMFSVGVILGLQAIAVPSLQAMLAKMLHKDDRGSAFALVSVSRLIATLIASIAFNLVYKPEDLDNGSDNPKTVYWMSASIWAATVPLGSLLLISDVLKCVTNKKTNDKDNL